MAPFSIPTPRIVPCCIPFFGGPKSIDTDTKIELFSDTQIPHEIFYTLDGTKPQPYAGIVQGSKTLKYASSFCLPAGKITVKAIAIHPQIHSMCSNIITKTFEVLKVEKNLKNKSSSNMNTKEMKQKSDVCSSLNSNSQLALNNITEAVSEHISKEEADIFDWNKFDNIEETCTDIDNLENEEYFKIKKDIVSSELSSIEESIGEENTIYDINGTFSLKEHSSPFKRSNFLPEVKDLLSDFPVDENGLNQDENLIELETNLPCADIYSTFTYEKNLKQCSSCFEMNSLTSKYCSRCGKMLKMLCKNCKEIDQTTPIFCQYCGEKFKFEDINKQEIAFHGNVIINESQKQNVCIQSSPLNIDKSVQTSPLKMQKGLISNTSPNLKKKLPPHSPGQGYWHQQLDFICNHLRSYAYNNIDFRKSISEPVLSKFQTAEVIKNEDKITVTLVFSPFITEKAIEKSTEQ